MKHCRVDHKAIATTCRAEPGQWQPVGEYNSTQSARGVLGYIEQATVRRDSQQSAYLPAGSFEARLELTEYGAQVEARYIGDRSPDEAWADALASLTAA